MISSIEMGLFKSLRGCFGKGVKESVNQLEALERRLATVEEKFEHPVDTDQDGKITEEEYRDEITRLQSALSDAQTKLAECQTLIDFMTEDGVPRTVDISSEVIRNYVDQTIVTDSQTNFGWFPDSIEAKSWTLLFKEMLQAASGMEMSVAGHILQVNITHE